LINYTEIFQELSAGMPEIYFFDWWLVFSSNWKYVSKACVCYF